MASRKKQEDKHLQILRELAGQPHNKKCFDCGQRGPTYVNMTIGAFVCTSCSGLLRGLNPPHRIKSISMATFASQEIEFLQNHGNEVCRQTWLALWSSELPPEPESRDEQKMRDFLIKKYERKVWYSSQPRAKTTPAPIPEAKPLKQLLGESAPQVVVNSTQSTHSAVSVASAVPALTQRAHPAAPPAASQPQLPPAQPAQAEAKRSIDLLSDLGGDPFAPTPTPSFNAFSPTAQPLNQPQVNQFKDPFSSSPAHSAGASPFGQPSSQPAPAAGFNAFQPQPVSQPLVDPFGTSPAHKATPAFNAFPMSTAQPAANAASGFDLFGGDSGSTASTAQAFNAFSNTTTQSSAASFANFGGGQAGQSSSDRYQALSQLDDLFRGSNTQSVFTSGPASSPASGTGQPNPFMSPATGASGAAMLQKQQQKPPNPFQTPASQPVPGGFGNQANFGGMQNAMQGGFRPQGQNLPVSANGQMGLGPGNFMGAQGGFGGATQQNQGPFGSGQPGSFPGNQPGGFPGGQGFPATQAGFGGNQAAFGAAPGGFNPNPPAMNQNTQPFGVQGGFGNQASFGGVPQANMGGFQGGNMMGMNQAGGQAFGGMGGGFNQQNAMQQPQQFGTWQQQPQQQQQPIGGLGGGAGGGFGGMGGFNMTSQVGMQKATNPFM